MSTTSCCMFADYTILIARASSHVNLRRLGCTSTAFRNISLNMDLLGVVFQIGKDSSFKLGMNFEEYATVHYFIP